MTTLMAIGGAMDIEEPVIFKEFIRRAGGTKARIVVLPQASGVKETGRGYCEAFTRWGVKSKPISLEFRERLEADRKKHLDALHNASGIFIAGGTQVRMTASIGGTEFEQELLRAFQRGAVVAGTSAGTAVMSKVMLAYGKSGATPRERIAQFSPGLGFTDKIIFDQHFRQRDRLGRLAYAISMHPGVCGVGVDENTCAIVEDDQRITVLGNIGDTWILRAQEAMSQSTTYLDNNYRTQLEKNLALFQSRHPAGSKYNTETYRLRSRLFRPKTRTAVRKMEAAADSAFFSNEDVVSVQAENGNDKLQQASAEIMKELLQYRLTKTIPWYTTVIGGCQDAMVQGVVCSYQ